MERWQLTSLDLSPRGAAVVGIYEENSPMALTDYWTENCKAELGALNGRDGSIGGGAITIQ
jgi:hypothetical protein